MNFKEFLFRIDRRLWLILLFAAMVLFYRLDHVDMVGDDAHYSVRAIGMVDFLFVNSSVQSTPIQWFKQLPWWANLSWHDHPVPLFLIQHAFLAIKPTLFFAKLPYALMALGTILLTYIIWSHEEGNDRWSPPRLRSPRADYGGQASSQSEGESPQLSSPYEGEARRGSTTVGLLAALFLALNAQFIWSGRAAFMESGVVFFLSLLTMAFFRFLENKQTWWQFGLALGLVLSVKFTTLFIVPTLVAYLLWQKRDFFKDKRLYGAFSLAFIICFPIIIYNAAMYLETGHFSLQFARLLGQTSPWHLSGVRTTSFGVGLVEIIRNLGLLVSWPYLAVSGGALVWLVIRRQFIFPLWAIFFLTVQQIFIGQEGYVLTVYSIFLAPVIAVAMADAFELLQQRGKRVVRLGQGALLLFSLFLVGFVVNSHSLVTHYGRVGLGYSASSSNNYGMLQLDRYLDTVTASDKTLTPLDPFAYIKDRSPRLRKYMLDVSRAERENSLKHSHVILFDSNISWFARVWLLEHRRFYRNIPLVTMNEVHFLRQMHVDNLYFVAATDYAPLDGTVNRNDRASTMEKRLVAEKHPFVPVYRDDGNIAFRVYHVDTTTLPQITPDQL